MHAYTVPSSGSVEVRWKRADHMERRTRGRRVYSLATGVRP
jgi:hypothetical protein